MNALTELLVWVGFIAGSLAMLGFIADSMPDVMLVRRNSLAFKIAMRLPICFLRIEQVRIGNDYEWFQISG